MSNSKRGAVDWGTAVGGLLLALIGASSACFGKDDAGLLVLDGGATDANSDAGDGDGATEDASAGDASPPVASRAVGVLDNGFGDGGVIQVAGAPGLQGVWLGLDSSDRIRVATSFAPNGWDEKWGTRLYRLTPDGARDLSFGNAGEQTLLPVTLISVLELLGVATTSADRLKVGIMGMDSLSKLTGLASDGSVDVTVPAVTFSSYLPYNSHGNGRTTSYLASETTGGTLAVGLQGFTGGIVVAHVAADGVVDNPGAPMPGRDTYFVRGAVSVPGGNVLVPGVDKLAPGRQFVVSLRGGVPDPAFGVDGWFFTTLGTPAGSDAVAFAVAPDGHIYIAAGPGLHVQRLLPDGSVDASYGVAGRVDIDMPGVPSTAALDREGALLVGVEALPTSSIVRLDPSGSLDSTFGVGGLATIPLTFSNYQSHMDGVAVQSTGKIVVVGVHNKGSVMAARLR